MSSVFLYLLTTAELIHTFHNLPAVGRNISSRPTRFTMSQKWKAYHSQ